MSSGDRTSASLNSGQRRTANSLPVLLVLGLALILVGGGMAVAYASSAPTALKSKSSTTLSEALLVPGTRAMAAPSDPGPAVSSVAASEPGAGLAQPLPLEVTTPDQLLLAQPQRDYPTNLDDLPPLRLAVQDPLPPWTNAPLPPKDYPTNTDGLAPLVPPAQQLATGYYPRVPAPLSSHMLEALARTAAAQSYLAQGSVVAAKDGKVAGLLVTQGKAGPRETYLRLVQVGVSDALHQAGAGSACPDLEIWTAASSQRTRCNDPSHRFAYARLALQQSAEPLPFALIESLLRQCQNVSLLDPDLGMAIPADGYLCAGDDEGGLGHFALTLWTGQADGYVSSLDLRAEGADGGQLYLDMAFSRFSEGGAVIPAYQETI